MEARRVDLETAESGWNCPAAGRSMSTLTAACSRGFVTTQSREPLGCLSHRVPQALQ